MPDTLSLAPRRFPADGPLALSEEHLAREYDRPPSAFFFGLLSSAEPTEYRLVDGVAVVDVQGPLDQRGGWWWDGYEAITERAAAAFADPKARAVVLACDSPGGVAAGNLACAQRLRALADASGKPLVAHAGTIALSAAYALACAAERIVVTDDGAVGSVGTIQTVYDRTEMTRASGLDVRVVRSGNLKADPHPDVPLTDASVARVRARINELAQKFAAWVGERRGQSAEDVLGHQGAVVYAPRALEAGLADAIGPLEDAIDSARNLAAERAANDTRKKMDEKSTRALGAILEAVGATDPDAAVAKVQAAVADAAAVPALRARLETVERERFDAKVASALDAARRSGRLTPAMEAEGTASAKYIAGRVKASDLEGLEAYLGALPAQVTVATPQAPRAPTPAADGEAAEALSQEEREWATAFGIAPDKLLATKRADARKTAARQGAPQED